MISLWGHSPNKLHRMVTILDLKVLFELKIMPLPCHSFFVNASFAKNPILTFFLRHKLRTFVNDWWSWTRTGLKGSVEHSCKWCDHRHRSICCIFQVVSKEERSKKGVLAIHVQEVRVGRLKNTSRITWWCHASQPKHVSTPLPARPPYMSPCTGMVLADYYGLDRCPSCRKKYLRRAFE